MDNWARWARQGRAGYKSLLGRLYVPSKDELVEEGQWVSKPSSPAIPIDDKAALKMEKAILRLPTDKFDMPKLIVWHYIHSKYASESRHYKTCRKMRVKVYRYNDHLKDALQILERRYEVS